MDINTRNDMIIKAKQNIKERKQHLYERMKELQSTNIQNEYLESVKDDYSKYFNYINNIKKDQLNAFENINQYLNKIGCELKTTDTLLKETKYDQQLIVQQINKIKQELNHTINN